jgi:hypothetical protein
MQRISFGKKVTNNTFIQGDGTIATSSSASTDGPDTGAHVSDTGDDMMILSGTKRRRNVIHSDDEEENVDDENNTSFSSSSSINSGKSKVEIFVL